MVLGDGQLSLAPPDGKKAEDVLSTGSEEIARLNDVVELRVGQR